MSKKRVDASDWTRKLKRASAAIREEAATLAVEAGSLKLAEEAKMRAPFKTGTLRRSIQTEKADRGQLKARVVGPLASVPYAAMIEYGGVITPKKARMLAWRKPNGEWAFARKVVRRAQPYMRPAFDESQRKVQLEMVKAFRTVFNKVAEELG